MRFTSLVREVTGVVGRLVSVSIAVLHTISPNAALEEMNPVPGVLAGEAKGEGATTVGEEVTSPVEGGCGSPASPQPCRSNGDVRKNSERYRALRPLTQRPSHIPARPL
jgi:hypothetical protein